MKVPKVRNELHHWWPRSLSRFWADVNGDVHCVSANGDFVQSQPKAFGAIRNANTIKLADEPTVWDHSFESTFCRADSEFPNLIDWLQKQSSPIQACELELMQRLTSLNVTDREWSRFAECLASLISRSPSFRYRVRRTTEFYRKQFGFDDPTADKNLIGLNVRGAQQMLVDAMSRGKLAVLFSRAEEFIFGDGFFHNVSTVSGPPHSPRCLIPLTPEIAVFFTKPMKYRTFPRALALNLTSAEVSFVNYAVQVYSERFIFFREVHPVIDDAFLVGEHRQFRHDKHPWIDALQTAVADKFEVT